MKEFCEDDSEIRDLFKKEGILSTSEIFSQNVMMLIETEEKKKIFEYKPLISRKAGVTIFIGIFLISAICWIISQPFAIKETNLPAFISEFMLFIKHHDFSFNISTNALQIGTSVIALICILLCLDLWINYRNKQQIV